MIPYGIRPIFSINKKEESKTYLIFLLIFHKLFHTSLFPLSAFDAILYSTFLTKSSNSPLLLIYYPAKISMTLDHFEYRERGPTISLDLTVRLAFYE